MAKWYQSDTKYRPEIDPRQHLEPSQYARKRKQTISLFDHDEDVSFVAEGESAISRDAGCDEVEL